MVSHTGSGLSRQTGEVVLDVMQNQLVNPLNWSFARVGPSGPGSLVYSTSCPLELVFRGFEQYFPHCTDKVGPFGAEFLLSKVPWELR